MLKVETQNRKKPALAETYLSPLAESLYFIVEQSILETSQLEGGSDDEGWGQDVY